MRGLIILLLIFYYSMSGQTSNNLIIVLPPEQSISMPAITTPYNPVPAGMQNTMWEIERNNMDNYHYTGLTIEEKNRIWDNYAKNDMLREYGKKPRYYCSKAANLRTGASVNYPVASNMEKYDYVFVIEGGYEWWKVYYAKKDEVGWVHKSLLISDPIK
jgi:hypothetical protein